VVRATLAWKAGDKDQALTSARQAAVMAAAQPQAGAAALPVAPFERFATAVAAGTPPTLGDFQSWLTAERAK